MPPKKQSSAPVSPSTQQQPKLPPLPGPPRCPERPGAKLAFHGDEIERPFDWLRNLSDPAVTRYLRSEAQYCNTVQKLHMQELRARIAGEIAGREPDTDAALPDKQDGFWWWEEDGDESADTTNDAVNAAAASSSSGGNSRAKSKKSKKSGGAPAPSAAAAPAAVSCSEATEPPTVVPFCAKDVNVIGHTKNDKTCYKRAPIDRAAPESYLDACASVFSADYFGGSIADPPGTHVYLDLNVIARRYNLQNADLQDSAVSPSCMRVVVSLDSTSGGEEMSVVVWDIARKRQLAVIGPIAHLVASPSSGSKKARGGGGGGPDRSPHGIVVQDVQICNEAVCFLDEDTVAFVGVQPGSRQSNKVWALYIGDDDDEKPRLTLLYEEKNPAYEISGLFMTASKSFVCVTTCHSATYETLYIATPLFVAQQQLLNPTFRAPSGTGEPATPAAAAASPRPRAEYTVRAFRPRIEGEQIALDHDPRPVSFFTEFSARGKKDKEDGNNDTEEAAAAATSTSASTGGTWFITANFMLPATAPNAGNDAVFLCSDAVDTAQCANWLPFFIPPPPKAPPRQAACAEAPASSSSSAPQSPLTACLASAESMQSIVLVDEIEPYRDFIVLTARVGGLLTLFVLDLLKEAQRDGGGGASPQPSFPYTLPLALSDFVDVCALMAQEPVFSPRLRAGTFLESGASPDWDDTDMLFEAHNPVVPTIQYRLARVPAAPAASNDPAAAKPAAGRWAVKLMLAEKVAHFNDENYACEMRLAPVALDGNNSAVQHIPLLMSYRTDKVDLAKGGCPCVLETYSSYADAHDVAFSSERVSLLNRGIIFAVAICRGSGEFGRGWYTAGAQLNRHHTFHDFVGCARWLKSSGIASRICIRGESAGGTVVGAAVNIAPELFVGAVARVPFVDVLRTMLCDASSMTLSERFDWGDPRADAATYRAIKAYSPVDNVLPPAAAAAQGTVYPSLWVESGLRDRRVSYSEPAIWVAMLRRSFAASAAAGRVLLHKVNERGGHDGDSERDDGEQYANEYAFICYTLGILK